MASDSRCLVEFENVTATIGGRDVSSILELSLTASANGIPAVTLMVDAGHPEAADKPTLMDMVSLRDAGSLYSTFRGMVKTNGATLSLSVTARPVSGGGDSQTLSISGWMLTDVALSPVAIGGVCAISLTCMHPLCKADLGGIVPGLLSSSPDWSGIDGGDPLSVFASALRVYGEQAKREKPADSTIAGLGGQGSVRSNLLTRLSQASAALTGALSWSGGGLPAEKVAADWGDHIRRGIAYYAMPSGGSSVFSRFAGGVVPDCSLAIGGDYTGGKLDVGPFAPWTSPTMSIDDSDITDMQFPGQDPSPISGVKIETVETAYDTPNSMTVRGRQYSTVRSDNIYVPQSELGAEYLYGPIHQFSEPGWLMHAYGHAFQALMSEECDTVSATTGGYQDPRTVQRGGQAEVSAADDDMKKSYNSALLACAKAYFETSLMKDWEFTVGARFVVRSGGGILCPGRVLAVRAGGSTVIAGYVTTVRHVISVPGMTARTEISCTHPRVVAPPFGIGGSSNALY